MKRILVAFFVLSFALGSSAGAVEMTKKLLIVNGSAESLSAVNLSTAEVSNTEGNVFGLTPNDIVVHNGKGYIVNSGSADISIIDLDTYAVSGIIGLPAGSNPWSMVFTGVDEAYVTSFTRNRLYVVDVTRRMVTDSIAVGERPEGMLRVGTSVYATNTAYNPVTYGYGQGTVSIIDIESRAVTATLDVSANPQELALGPDGKVYVLCTGNYSDQWGTIAVIETTYPEPDYAPTPQVTGSIAVGGSPGDLEITSQGRGFISAGGEWNSGTKGYVYLVNISSGEVLRGSSNPIIVGNGATRVLIDDETGDVFVSCYSADVVQRLDPVDGTVLATYAAGDGPSAMALAVDYGDSDPFADEVVRYVPGADAGIPFQAYFPQCVLGPPDRSRYITDENPSSDPKELLSLGTAGEIVLKFSDNVIVDGPGVDFTVFENPFYSPWSEEYFIEAGIVSVSQDGVTWYTFPYDTATYAGLAGKTPTKTGDPADPNVSGGDSFNLSDLPLSIGWVSYVKIEDLGKIKKEGAFNGDFDLDAVAAVNSAPGASTEAGATISRTVSPDSEMVSFDFLNQAALALSFTSGEAGGKSVSATAYGVLIPEELKSAANFSAVCGYYRIESELQGFTAGMHILYSDSVLRAAGIPEHDLILAYYDESGAMWRSQPTSVDTPANSAYAEIDHFSYWALTDKNDLVIAGVETEGPLPARFALEQNYPNPFNPATTISYTLPVSSRVILTIYSILGQEIARLVDESQTAGVHTVRWDGRARNGSGVSSGVYIYRIETEDFIESRKMLLVK